MVTLTRITGQVFALNSDMIERVECSSGTVITLVDGATYTVRESLDEVVERVRRYRGGVIAAASHAELATDADLSASPDAPAHPAKDPRVVAFPVR